jgi:hypothetical protein
MKSIHRVLAALALAALLPLPALAHYLWLEAGDGGEARLFFGEYEEGLREKSPGSLDKIKNPQAWQVMPDGTRKPLTLSVRADHVTMPAPALPVVLEQAADTVVDMGRHGGQGKVRSVRYARLDAPGGDSRALLPLDIVPVKSGGELYRVTLNGAPLAKTKVAIHAPNGWSRELSSNEQGLVRVNAPWAGVYVLQVSHTQPQAGELRGESYDGVRMGATLSVRFEQPLAAR